MTDDLALMLALAVREIVTDTERYQLEDEERNSYEQLQALFEAAHAQPEMFRPSRKTLTKIRLARKREEQHESE